jgi:OPA family sugar phosphate sensor protein UhpC-like MFS transporter
LVFAYVGIYLCRKNLSVAVPLLQQEWSLSKEAVGMVASISTICYAFGKIFLGPIVDRLGGRRGLLAAMVLVAVFGALGAMAPTLLLLTVFYSANRLAGSAGWGSMVKMTPAWFSRRRLPLALGILSLSYVFGGASALAFAGIIARLTDDNWRMVLGIPSLVLLGLAVLAAFFLPRRGEHASSSDAPAETASAEEAFHWRHLPRLFRVRQLHVVCALSFTLTFLRETFNFWTVDYLKTEGGAELSIRAAAMLSTPFDILGGLGILSIGWIYGRLSDNARRRLVFWLLLALSLTLLALPAVARQGLWAAACVIGLVGFLVYGPYSLLAGVLAVEVKGRQYAATVAGLVDGTGYFAGVLSGVFFGRLLTLGGYALGFQVMAGFTLASAVICLFLYSKSKSPKP